MAENLEREIGIIIAKLERMEEDNKEAKQYRKVMSEKQDLQLTSIQQLQEDMKVVKPITDQITKWKAVGTGVVITVGFLGTTVGLMISSVRDYFKVVAQYLTGQ